jgi:uncharacterized NAD-dependent epimerase/dehydratase family protein
MFSIPKPYLIFVGEGLEALDVKTGQGLVEWRPEWCSGQYRLTESAYDLGLVDMIPSAAKAAGLATMVIGGATFGGRLTQAWRAAVVEAIEAGLNVASGMHDRLNADPGLAKLAKERGVSLFDVRGLPENYAPNVGNGRRRAGKRLLTVGTDCAVGKKFTALCIERDMRKMGLAATFRATGQTGVLISGGGIAIDAVVADFLAGVVETLSPDAEPDHWDIIEGQGALHHPAYGAVSLGLLHGSQPDAFVVCHEAGRTALIGYPEVTTPTIEECVMLNVTNARRMNSNVHCIGVSLNCAALTPQERELALAELEESTGLPVVDPLFGTDRLIEAMVSARPC